MVTVYTVAVLSIRYASSLNGGQADKQLSSDQYYVKHSAYQYCQIKEIATLLTTNNLRLFNHMMFVIKYCENLYSFISYIV